MKKLVLSFLMIVVLVSGVFCQTITTTSGNTVELATVPVITKVTIASVDETTIIVLATSEDTGSDDVVEIDGTIYRVK